MTVVLIILGVGAVIGVIFALIGRENPLAGAATGAFMAGGCLLQLLIPVAMLIIGLILWRAIF